MDKKRNIVEEALLSEGFGEGSAKTMGGTFHWGSQTGAQTWHHKSPRFRATTAAPTPDELLGITQAEEEEAHQAPPRKPYPMETIDENLVNAFLSLGNAEAQMKYAVKYNAFLLKEKEKRAHLEYLYEMVQQIRKMIREVAEDVDRITL